MIIGIDLGTTNSLVSYMGQSGPQIIPNALGDYLTPSVVGIDRHGEIHVGKVAKELQVTTPENCVSMFKRHMGSDWHTRLGGRMITATELSSLVLKSLRRDAEAFFDHTIDRAVITVPAYFNEPQRKATIQAGEMAGLQVERIINEPTAAAIAYGLHNVQDESVALVYDLGGGTFDVSIVDLFDGVLEIRASAGETFLGGEDFTTAMVSNILALQNEVYERAELQHPKMVSRLRKECESAKRRLTTEPEAAVRIPNHDGTFSETTNVVNVHRSDLLEWTEKVLARTERPIRRALGDAKLSKDEIEDVVLVGGATRMPLVAQHVTEAFGKTPKCTLNPDEVVAMGAAVQAALINDDRSVGDLVVTDVAPFTLGVEICRDIGPELKDGYFLPIINRNSTIPVSRISTLYTVATNQPSVNVRVYQGENRKVGENLLIGEFDLDGIPPGPAGQAIDVRFTYDLNGILEVEATVATTQRSKAEIITRHAKALSDEELQNALAAMRELKLHPREETANKHLLHKAERMYGELPPFERAKLDHLLDHFEAALNSQDPQFIEPVRERLTNYLDQFETHED